MADMNIVQPHGYPRDYAEYLTEATPNQGTVVFTHHDSASSAVETVVDRMIEHLSEEQIQEQIIQYMK